MSYELPKANYMNVYEILSFISSPIVLHPRVNRMRASSIDANMTLMLFRQMIHPPFKDLDSLSKCSPS